MALSSDAGTAPLYVRTNLRNTDPSFGGSLPDVDSGTTDESTPMTRSWGKSAGTQIKLENVRVSVWSQGDGTVHADAANSLQQWHWHDVSPESSGRCGGTTPHMMRPASARVARPD